jgi:hypothetical protein
MIISAATMETTTTKVQMCEKRLDLDLFSEESKSIVKEYICFICKGVLYHPVWNDSCQHIFCKDCLGSLISNTNTIKCPQCLSENVITNIDASCMTKPVNVLTSLIEKQMINCKNLCGWKSSVKELKNHLPLCPKLKLKCENPGCQMEISQDEKSNHQEMYCEFKNVECGKCEKKFLKKDERLHQDDCPFAIISCSKNCGESMERKNLENHLKLFCDNILMSCEFEIVGCTQKFLKKNEKDHITNFIEKHNELFSKFMCDTKKLVEYKLNSYDSILEEIKEKLLYLDQKNQKLKEVEEKSKGVYEEKKSFLNKKQKREIPAKKKLNINPNIFPDESANKILEEEKAASGIFELVKKENFIITNGVKIKKENQRKIYIAAVNNFSLTHPHEFLLLDDKLNTTNKIFKCRFEIKKENLKNWMAFGICIKEILVNNDLKIKNNFEEADHGFFGISTDGVLFQNNSSYKNNTKLQNFPNLSNFSSNNPSYSSIKFEYEYEKKILKLVMDEEYSFKIDMVFPSQPNMSLMPCLIFKSKIEELKVILE